MNLFAKNKERNRINKQYIDRYIYNMRILKILKVTLKVTIKKLKRT